MSTSGSANAATGAAGEADQQEIGRLLAEATGVAVGRTLHLSTGVIGTRLPLDRVAHGLAAIVPTLSGDDAALEAAAIALRTTDSVTKIATTTIELPAPGGHPVPITVSGIAKGVGMIHPRMATMLSVILTDAGSAPETLWGLLRPAAARTWNQLSVDGDTSTNDTVFVLASGASGAAPVEPGSPAAARLGAAIESVARDLARQQAADGEGASTLITATVTGAHDDAEARAVARAVVASSLVKAAAHGRDPNWGRIAGAAGNARLADAAVLEAAGVPAAEALDPRREPGDDGRGDTPDLDRRSSRVRWTGRRADRLRSRCGPGIDGGSRGGHRPRPGPGTGRRRSLRLRSDRGLRDRELRVHHVNARQRGGSR